ncbi:uroporphyrinogen-III synthase [Xanthomonas maliensis]|nr:uroporphyrinogen-III synthase [Xanthomonas maliensis]
MTDPTSAPASAWTLISLRSSGEHAPLRRAAARLGARVLAMSPWRIETLQTPQARAALQQALAAPLVLFTSPAAVLAAHRLIPLQRPPQSQWISVGEGTARALQAVGVTEVVRPTRMDSEGLLALSLLQAPLPSVGLVTAPGGRGLLAPALEQRGAYILRAEVYRRQPLHLRHTAVRALEQALPRCVVAVSSGEALTQVLQQLPAPLAEALKQRPLVASSDRLCAHAHQLGFVDVQRAEGPLPLQLARAAAAIVTPPRSC